MYFFFLRNGQVVNNVTTQSQCSLEKENACYCQCRSYRALEYEKIKGPNFQAPPSIHTSHYHGNSTKMNHNLGLLFLRFFFQAGAI